MKNKIPTIYQNDEGDYWIRKDQVPELKDAVAQAKGEYGDEMEFVGEESHVELTECEYECDGTKHPGHRRGKGQYTTWHFRYGDL